MGKNLCAELENIRTGKARCYGDLKIEEVRKHQRGTGHLLQGVRLRVQSGGRQPPERADGIHGGELRVCQHAVGYAEEAQEYLSSDVVIVTAGVIDWPLREFRVWQEQEGGGGHVPSLRTGSSRSGSSRV